MPHPTVGDKGLMSRQRPLQSCVASKGRKQMLPTGLLSGPPDWPQAFIVQPSDGHTGPTLPEFMFRVASRPSTCSRVGSLEDALSPALPSPWVLEGKATIAWVLLELDLLQGEDGGSVIELVYSFPERLEVGVT